MFFLCLRIRICLIASKICLGSAVSVWWIFNKLSRVSIHLEGLPSLTPHEIISPLKLCQHATFFAFRETFYLQIHRTALGLPVSVVVAELAKVMEDIKSGALANYPCQPEFWKCYVNDSNRLVPKVYYVSKLCNKLSKFLKCHHNPCSCDYRLNIAL